MGLFSCLGCASGVYEQEAVETLPPNAYLMALEETPHAYLLDIRTPVEYRKDHLPGARNFNFLSFSFGKKLDTLDKERPVFIYCQTAHRSPFVAKKLHKRGFRRIVDLEGGFRMLQKTERKTD